MSHRLHRAAVQDQRLHHRETRRALAGQSCGLLIVRDELVGLMASWEREGRKATAHSFSRLSMAPVLRHRPHRTWHSSFRISVFHFSEASSQTSSLPISIWRPARSTTTGCSNASRCWFTLTLENGNGGTRPGTLRKRAGPRTIGRLVNFQPVACGATPAGQYDKFPSFRFTDDAQELFIHWSIELHDRRIKQDQPNQVRT